MELILWLAEGRIAGRECARVTDDVPRSLPSVRNVLVGRRSG